MMKQFRLTIILLLVVAAVGVYIWFFERGEVTGRTAWKLDVTRIQRIELTSGGQTSVLERKGKTWRIAKPVSARVDRDLMKRLLDRLAKVAVRRSIEEPKALKHYGLAQPVATIKLVLEDGKTRALRLGDTTPDSSAVYASEKGTAKVLLVDTVLLDDAAGGASALRDRTALPFKRGKVERIVFERPGDLAKLEKRAKQWKLVEPVAADADTYAVDDFLMALEEMEASRFPAEEAGDRGQYGLAKPRLTVAVTTSGAKKPTRISFGAETDADEFYAQNSIEPAVMAVSKAAFDRINKTAADLRSKMIAAIDVDDVKRLAIARGNLRFELRREDEDRWRLTSPRAMDADAQTVEDILWELSDLRAEAFVDQPAALADYGLDPPQAAATVYHGRRKTPVRIWLGMPARAGRIYAKAAGETIYEVASGILGRLPTSADDLRDLALFSYEPGTIKRLRAVYGGRTVALERDGAKWRMTEPEKRPANSERVQQLLSIVEHVRAERYVTQAASALTPYVGPNQGTLRLTVAAEGHEDRTLGAFVLQHETQLQLANDSALFEAPPGFFKDLTDALNAVAREK